MTGRRDPGGGSVDAGGLRWGVRGAVLAAAALAVSGAVALLTPYANMGPEGSISWFVIESADAVAEVGVLVALLALHALHGRRAGWVGRAGTGIAGAGSALMAVATVWWLLPVTDGLLLDILVWGGVLGWLVGFPLVGAGARRARVLPRWTAGLLAGWSPLFLAVFVLTNWFGEARALLALPWLAVAWALSTAGRAGRAAPEGARARA